jgi:beta-glucosidase
VLHFTAKDYDDASAQAINAGLDVIFQTEYQHYKLFIPPFLDGRISQERIDDAVARVLRQNLNSVCLKILTFPIKILKN